MPFANFAQVAVAREHLTAARHLRFNNVFRPDRNRDDHDDLDVFRWRCVGSRNSRSCTSYPDMLIRGMARTDDPRISRSLAWHKNCSLRSMRICLEDNLGHTRWARFVSLNPCASMSQMEYTDGRVRKTTW